MQRYLLALAVGALLMSAGVVVGSNLGGDEAARAPVVDPLRAEAPAAAPAATPAPKLMGQPLDAQILMRLARLEEQLEVLTEQQKKLAESVEPAAAMAAMFGRHAPRLATARLDANQTAAIATLRNCCSAQAQFQQSGKADTDGDGTGEYAGFREMSGAGAGRMSAALVPPVLSGAFRALNGYGEVSRSGYLYRIYLPDSQGRGIGEPTEGYTSRSGLDSDLAETTWCAYAWPVSAKAGSKIFFMNQGGDVLVTEDTRYIGPGNGPRPDAAFKDAGVITGAVAIGIKGTDGNVWVQGG